MSQYYPPYKSSSNNIKVELDLANYATKTDLKNITHVDVSSFPSKTNLAALKTEVDEIDADKLKTTPTDLAKLTNAVEHDVVKKTDYNTKVTSIEAQIAGLTKNTVDNLADITKLKAIDTNSFVTRTKFSADTNALNDKIDDVEKNPPDISGLATKTSLNDYLQTVTFNSKVTEVKDADIIAKSAVTKANTIRSDLTDYAKKADVATDITTIKNDYVSNASLTSRLNDLKSQHIATEVKAIDDKTKKNSSDILSFESRLKQKEDTINENERGLSFNREFFYYLQKCDSVYECKFSSSVANINKKISKWKSTGIFDYISSTNMIAVKNASGELPDINADDDDVYVYLSGNHFQQDTQSFNNDIINIHCVYKLDPISFSRDNTFTVQNTLFESMQITKNADTSKYKYKGYGICFDEGGMFSIGNINNGRNVLIFGVHESSLVHTNNKANNIFIIGDGFVQGINDMTLYAEKIYSQNFTQSNKKLVLSLHYNDNDSYLFITGKQELKFTAKPDKLIKEKLCIGNLSSQWTASESEKTGLYGNIYDFIVDYTRITDVKFIYDMHRYLMINMTLVYKFTAGSSSL